MGKYNVPILLSLDPKKKKVIIGNLIKYGIVGDGLYGYRSGLGGFQARVPEVSCESVPAGYNGLAIELAILLLERNTKTRRGIVIFIDTSLLLSNSVSHFEST